MQHMQHPSPSPSHDLDEASVDVPYQEIWELSGREIQVLLAAWEGLTIKETAVELRVMPSTVKNYRANIFRKWDVRNVEGMLRRGVEKGYLGASLRAREEQAAKQKEAQGGECDVKINY